MGTTPFASKIELDFRLSPSGRSHLFFGQPPKCSPSAVPVAKSKTHEPELPERVDASCNATSTNDPRHSRWATLLKYPGENRLTPKNSPKPKIFGNGSRFESNDG
jgi:hypothetical protein